MCLSSSAASASSSFEPFGVDGRGWFVAVGGGGDAAGGDGCGVDVGKVMVLQVSSKSRSVFIEKHGFFNKMEQHVCKVLV